jgi:hypothetical protein
MRMLSIGLLRESACSEVEGSAAVVYLSALNSEVMIGESAW